MAKATFGAGCFWGVEEVFRTLDGVDETLVGYMGGSKDRPTYKEVCTDTTGHAEVVEVSYDPNQISFSTLVEVFFSNHNPTQLNMQGPDVGSQYRSVIFYADDEQKVAAEEAKASLIASGRFKKDIVTAIEPATTFWAAEEYHQKYLMKRGMSSCHI